MTKINDIDLADGKIISIAYEADKVVLKVTDWQEKNFILEFYGVVGIESYSPENVDLSQFLINKESESLKLVCSRIEEDLERVYEYQFISVWNDQAILTIYSEGLQVNRA